MPIFQNTLWLEMLCLIVGVGVQFIFLLQDVLLKSRRPAGIWWIAALLGSAMVIVYGISRSDALLITGQAFLVAVIVLKRPGS